MAKITLIGFEKWLNHDADSLFKDIVLPTAVNKDIFIDSLLLAAGEFPVIYSNPNFMKEAVTNWSKKNLDNFKRIFDAWFQEYNPLHNYDRSEDITDSETRTGGSTSTRSDSETNTTSTSSGVITSTEQENKVSAYDESSYSPKDKTVGSVGEQSAVSGESGGSSSGSSGESHSDMKAASHQARITGNIGIVSSQKMLTDELMLRSAWNPYNLMIDSFISEFVIPVYV